MKKVVLFLITWAVVVMGNKIPDVTNIVAKDITGKTWNIDELLNSGKVIWAHQMFAG